MLFQNTDNLVPVKKKSVAGDKQHRSIADLDSKPAPRPRSVSKSKVVPKRKSVPKPGLAAKPGPVIKSRAGQAAGKHAGGNDNRVPPGPSLKTVVVDALADMKALDIKVLDVRGLTDIADFMVIASGTSDRHVRSVAQRVVEKTKEAGFRPHGVEGQQDSDWVLIDLNEMIVHVMLPRVREFYGLEKLWDMTVTKRAARA